MKKLLIILAFLPLIGASQEHNKILMLNGKIVVFSGKKATMPDTTTPTPVLITCDSIVPCDAIIPCDAEYTSEYIIENLNNKSNIKYFKHEEILTV